MSAHPTRRTSVSPSPCLSRRRFLGLVGGGAAAIGLATGSGAADEAGAPARHPLDPDAVRGALRLRPGLTYLNNGTLGPSPAQVGAAMTRAWEEIESNPADQVFGPVGAQMETVRAAAARFLGCDLDEIAITHNTTDGMNAIAAGVELAAGDRVLTTDQEHPGGLAGWHHRVRRDGVKLDHVPLGDSDADRIVERFAQRLTPRTRVVCASHVTTTTGLRLPIARLGAMARAAGALMVVDGAQAAGALQIDVHALGCDAYATSGHKWMLGPKGTGLLYIRREARAAIDPLRLSNGMGCYTAATGTRNVPAILGLGAAIDFLNRLGSASVERHALGLRNRLDADLRRIEGIRVASPAPGDAAAPMLTFELPASVDSGAFAASLRRDDDVIVKVVPRGHLNGIRVSTHVYNQEADLGRLLAAIRRRRA